MAKTNEFRAIRFESATALFADINVLAAAELEDRLTSCGTWTLGQAINHLAVWAEFAFTGSPAIPPWIIRKAARLMKGRILRKGMPRGIRIPKVPGGTLGIKIVPTEQAIMRLRNAIEHLERESPTVPNSLLGPLTREEHLKLQFRHAELHLSCFKTK